MERLNIDRQDDRYDDSYYESDPEPRDPEISLGAATILGIFLALTLICALFFGLGYSMGRRSAQTAVVTNAEPAPTPTTTKPASGNPIESPAPPPAITAVPQNPAPPSTKDPEKIAAKPTAAPAIPAGNFIVQVAAVSHREDAESLINALEQRGYTVFIRNEPQDKLLHVQVGPFPTRKDADAMRQHLLYDGYNAIIK